MRGVGEAWPEMQYSPTFVNHLVSRLSMEEIRKAIESVSQEQKDHAAIFGTSLPPDQANKAKLSILKSNLAELARELVTKHQIKVEKYLPKKDKRGTTSQTPKH